MQTNSKWFKDRIADKRLTQRSLAKLMEMDQATLSLLLQGRRRMTIEHAAELARLLGVSVLDVMRNAGVVVNGHSEAASPALKPSTQTSLPLIGHADAEERAFVNWKDVDTYFDISTAAPEGAGLVQWRTAQSALDQRDGWLMITLPPTSPNPEDMLDRFGLVGLANGETVVRTVRRGYTKGRFTLLAAANPPIPDAEIEWFAPILAMIPPS